jgi:adenosylcobinamide-GDP ribazoletransferase
MLKKMHEQGLLLKLALSFLTRIPVRLSEEIKPEMLHQASRYFALIGFFIGVFSALSYWLLAMMFPDTITVILVMAINLLLTGAFHEDGWADVWDGFGGGWSIEQKLTIMKDSRLGTYGAAALFIILMLKYQSLVALSETNAHFIVITGLILGHTLSRILATSLILSLPYVSEDSTSKVKPVAQHLSQTSFIILLSTGIIVLGFSLTFSFLTVANCIVLVVVLISLRLLLILWFKHQLSGFTGDCLGAAQQISEVCIYLTLLVLASNSGILV